MERVPGRFTVVLRVFDSAGSENAGHHEGDVKPIDGELSAKSDILRMEPRAYQRPKKEMTLYVATPKLSTMPTNTFTALTWR